MVPVPDQPLLLKWKDPIQRYWSEVVVDIYIARSTRRNDTKEATRVTVDPHTSARFIFLVTLLITELYRAYQTVRCSTAG